MGDPYAESLASGRIDRPSTPAGHVGRLVYDLEKLRARIARPLRECLQEAAVKALADPALDQVGAVLDRAIVVAQRLFVALEAQAHTPSRAAVKAVGRARSTRAGPWSMGEDVDEDAE